jgi:hypothetical protein
MLAKIKRDDPRIEVISSFEFDAKKLLSSVSLACKRACVHDFLPSPVQQPAQWSFDGISASNGVYKLIFSKCKARLKTVKDAHIGAEAEGAELLFQ